MGLTDGQKRHPTHRRSVLTGLGALAATGVAGCIEADSESDPDGDAEAMILEGFEEAGVTAPQSIQLLVNNERERVAWAELVATVLTETGLFEVDLEEREWGTFVAEVNSVGTNEGRNPLVCLGLTGGWDPHSYVNTVYHSTYATPNGLNIYHYDNETVDDLIDSGRSTFDDDERVSTYHDLQRTLVSESVLSYIHFGEQHAAWDDSLLSGFRVYPLAGDVYKGIYAPQADVYTERTDSEDELIVDTPADIPNTDPVAMDDTVSQFMTGLIYERLIESDFHGNVRPFLATNWEQLDDAGYDWRFELRPDVTFHNGDELTARDVQYSLERHEGTVRHADVYDWYDSLEIVGEYEFTLTLRRPFGPLEHALSDIPIVPTAAGDGSVSLTEEPVGTGPYQFDGHDADARFRLRRFDDHWYTGEEYDNDVPATPPIETITMQVISDATARHNALETGEIHLSAHLPLASVGEFETATAFTVDRTVSGDVEFLAYPLETPPFDNRLVRRGISKLIPRERIVTDVFYEVGEPAVTPISPLLPAVTDESFRDKLSRDFLDT